MMYNVRFIPTVYAVAIPLALIPGRWVLKKYMREKTTFSSNVGVNRL
jgi:hypothetical protein